MNVTAVRGVVWLGNVHRRVLAALLGVLGPRLAYGLMAVLARWLYQLSDPLRQRSEAQCQAALKGRIEECNLRDISERAFVHRVWNLTDLMLANRYVRPSTLDRCGGCIPEPYLSELREAQERRQPLLFLTAYYGPYDLLPLFMGYNGIRPAVVYRPHLNPAYDAYRRAVRSRSGCEMVRDTEAVSRLPRILESGGSVAILSDHHVARRGVPVSFLGLPTIASRAVGILAERYAAPVVVAGVRRRERPFSFEIVVADMFDQAAWQDAADPIVYITERYVAALERMVLDDPSQYLWAHARWGESLAHRLAGEAPAPEAAT